MDRRVAVLFLLVSCKDPPAPPKPDASIAPATPIVDAKKVVENGCLSCHQEDMLQQQRLTKAQWEKTVTKMAGWGANIEEAEKPALVLYLAEHYGPDAGAFEPPTDESIKAKAATYAHREEEWPAGDAAAGRAKYIDKCSGCHGSEALGHIGVRLADRPILWQADQIEDLVRRGKGKMPPAVVERQDLADILAHLRSLQPKTP